VCVDLSLSLEQSRAAAEGRRAECVCKQFNRSHAHAAANKPLTTYTTHEHRASNGAKTTTLNSRSRRRRPQAAAQRCTSALEPAAHQRNWPPPRENDSHRSSSREAESELEYVSLLLVCKLRLLEQGVDQTIEVYLSISIYLCYRCIYVGPYYIYRSL